MEKVFNIDSIKFKLLKSNRASNIYIKIKSSYEVNVSVPRYVSFKKALKICESKIPWIKRSLGQIKSREDSLTIFNIGSEFKTRNHTINIILSNRCKIRSNIQKNKVLIEIPYFYKIEDISTQNKIRELIEEIWRLEAKTYLPNLVSKLANNYGFIYNKVSVRNTKSQWGSCSHENNISLSLHLMRLDDNLINYVILHELVHTKIKNHGKEFWKLLDFVSGDAKKLDKEIKKYDLSVY